MATNLNTKFGQPRRTVAPQIDVAASNDAELVTMFIEAHQMVGDKELADVAFKELIRRHGPMVRNVCRKLLWCREDADEVYISVFAVLARTAADVIRRRKNVAGYLYLTAFNIARNERRKARRHQKRCRSLTGMPEQQAANVDPSADLQLLIHRELNRLPEKYRLPIVLCGLEGMKRAEAAKQLGRPDETVAKQLIRGRAMLAKRLTRCGVAVPAGALAAALSQSAATAGVPSSLAFATIKTASIYAAGQGAVGMVSANVVALTEGVLKSMQMTKLLQTIATASLLAVGVLAAGGLVFETQAAAEPPKTPGLIAAAADTKAASETFPMELLTKKYFFAGNPGLPVSFYLDSHGVLHGRNEREEESRVEITGAQPPELHFTDWGVTDTYRDGVWFASNHSCWVEAGHVTMHAPFYVNGAEAQRSRFTWQGDQALAINEFGDTSRVQFDSPTSANFLDWRVTATLKDDGWHASNNSSWLFSPTPPPPSERPAEPRHFPNK